MWSKTEYFCHWSFLSKFDSPMIDWEFFAPEFGNISLFRILFSNETFVMISKFKWNKKWEISVIALLSQVFLPSYNKCQNISKENQMFVCVTTTSACDEWWWIKIRSSQKFWWRTASVGGTELLWWSKWFPSKHYSKILFPIFKT